MHPTVSLLALVLASLAFPVTAAEQMAASNLSQDNSSQKALGESQSQAASIAPAQPQLNVTFPDIQQKINDDLRHAQQEAQAIQEQSPSLNKEPQQIPQNTAAAPQAVKTYSNQPQNNILPINNSYTQVGTTAQQTNDGYYQVTAPAVPPTPPTAPTAQTPPTAPYPATNGMNAGSTNTLYPQAMQPVAMVQFPDGRIYPVYTAPGQQFNPNLSYGPEGASAFLGVPENFNPAAGSTANIAASASGSNASNQNISVNNSHSAKSGYQDPAYSPKVKVFGNKTPTMIGSREQVRNYVNEMQQSGAYTYNLDSQAAYNQYTNQYYNQYYNQYDPYYGSSTYVSYYQDSDGKWHKILGFRFDPYSKRYIPIYAGYGSCTGPDCPVIYDPNHPYANMPQPSQPPVWNPPPSWQDPVDPSFNHPATRPPYPSQPPVWNPPPNWQDPVDPGFNHPATRPPYPSRPPQGAYPQPR